MRCELWPERGAAYHRTAIDQFFSGVAREPIAVLVAADAEEDLLGFVELSIRSYAEGCETDHVAYVEGWYVGPAARRHGVGRALIDGAEEWARNRGCAELASDADARNHTSQEIHRSVGFDATGQIVCFRKAL